MKNSATTSEADSVAISVQPTTTQAGRVMTPAVTVRVEKPGGAVDQGYNGPVTLGYAVNRLGAPAPAGAVVSAVHGVAIIVVRGLTASIWRSAGRMYGAS